MSARIEKDYLSEMAVPEGAYYGIHTVRAARNFPVSNSGVPEEFTRALAEVKKACTLANLRANLLDARIGEAIIEAATEIASGKLTDQFITDAFQGGAGKSTDMNISAVVANRASELLGGEKGQYRIVDPLEHANLSQSTNDVYPTALKVAAIRLVLALSEEIARLEGALQEKESAFGDILTSGRTEMQDASPVTLSQEFGAYAEARARDRGRIFNVEEGLRQVNLGGTAIGTGLNAETEMVSQVSFHVMSRGQAITLAAFSGQLELNAFLPLITFSLITALKLLIYCVTLFRIQCVDRISADPERCRRRLEDSLCLATALAPYVGYDTAAALSKEAADQGTTIRHAALQQELFTTDELDVIFSPSELTRPGTTGLRKLKTRKKGGH